MAEFAQAYIHIDIGDLTDQELDVLIARLEEQAVAIAAEIYGPGFELDIRVEEGTLKVWLKVLGTIGGIIGGGYAMVATYPDFKAGAAELYEDATTFFDKTTTMVQNETGVSDDAVISKRKRLKNTKRIQQIVEAVDELEKQQENMLIPDKHTLIDHINDQLSKLKKEIGEEEIEKLLEILPHDAIPELPNTPEDIKPPRAALRPRGSGGGTAMSYEPDDVDKSLPVWRAARPPRRKRRKYHNTISLRDRISDR